MSAPYRATASTRSAAGTANLQPAEHMVLAQFEGPGIIRHIRLVTENTAEARRGLVIRAWWDEQTHPSVEAPVGDFFGFAHGRSRAYASAVHGVGDAGVLDIWLPMPFAAHAHVTIDNELSTPTRVTCSVAATIGDTLPDDFAALHAHFRREAPTTPRRDFEFMPLRTGRGRFVGTVFGVIPLAPHWWGEGEAMFYLDGDRDWPTLVGSGAEDYVGLAWNVQQSTFPLHGASMVQKAAAMNKAGPVSMYRWHLHDPIYWHESIRATIQQIGVDITSEGALKNFDSYLDSLRERQDDWSCCSFWYEPLPSAPLPVPVKLALRLHGLEWTNDLGITDV